MGKAFAETVGSGSGSKIPSYEYKNGEHRIRLIGDVLPRYIYWLQGADGGNKRPVESLAFNREKEVFDNNEGDVVKEFFPNEKCAWSYAMLCINLDGTPEVQLLNLKKKMFNQIMDTAKELGDPTDPETGWDVVFTRKKTGPHQYNVEYTVNVLQCSKRQRPLTDEERKLVEDSPTIDEVLPRHSPEKQREFLNRLVNGDSGEEPEEAVQNELEGTRDLED